MSTTSTEALQLEAREQQIEAARPTIEKAIALIKSAHVYAVDEDLERAVLLLREVIRQLKGETP